jgi:hypothetical protein
MIWREDAELKDWIWNVTFYTKDHEDLPRCKFLSTVADAARRADHEDYVIFRPALLELKKKYPQYERREGTANAREL